jgi:Tol biopolymer transport system component
MPTRRQLLHGGAVSVAGAGAAAVLASCTPPPPAVPPRRYATLQRQLNGYRRDLILNDHNGYASVNILQNVFGRAAWFPDGSSICIARGSLDDSQGTWALWVCRSDGSLLRAITSPAAGVADLDPCVGLDGQTIVFCRDSVGFGTHTGIWIVQANGQGLHPVRGSDFGVSPSFSHDQKFIVYAAPDGIRRIPAAGGTPMLIARGAFGWQLTQPTWSVANNRVAFIRRDAPGAASLCYVAGTGGRINVVLSTPTQIECPTWGSDSTTLHYARYEGFGSEGRGATDVYRQAIGGPSVRIFRPFGPPATDLSTLP